MGSYTFVDNDENITITNLDGLKDFLEKVKTIKDYENTWNYVELKNDVLSFQGMSDRKLISYWYEDTLVFLRDIALFIEGIVYLCFETDEEFAKLIFEDGECKIELGKIEYIEYKLNDLKRNQLPMNDYIKKQHLLKHI